MKCETRNIVTCDWTRYSVSFKMNISEWYADAVEHSTVVTRATDSSSSNDYWSASPYFLEILIPIVSSFLLLRRRDLFGRLLLNLDKKCLSALCPSLSKREHLLKWAQRGIMPSWMPCPMNISLTLDDVWKDGSLLCTLINSAVPGACPNPHRHRNKPPTHGQALAYKYFGLAPIFTNEDFDQDLNGNLEFMFFMYLTQLRTNISQFSRTNSSDIKYTSSYIARGMGLVTGEQYKKCVFYLYPNVTENDTGVLVTIQGPYHAYGCITLPPFYILKTSSEGNRKKRVFYIEEDIKKLRVVKTRPEKHLFRSITSAIIPFLRNARRNSVTTKIRIEANKEPDRIKLTYVPQHPGVHIMCIITDGCHLQGSPFNVSVSECNVEEIQKEADVAKTELACDLIPQKSKPLNEIKWMNTMESPLSSNHYFNKSTCCQNEPNLFEKYNRINYQRFCKKFELFRSSFDEIQEFSLDSLEDEGFFANNKVKFMKSNSIAFERFTDSIKKVMKMVKHHEVNHNSHMIEGRKITKAICDKTNTFNAQEQGNENEKIRYFEEKHTTKRLGETVMIKNYNVVLGRNPITEFAITTPKRVKKQENNDIEQKSSKSSIENVVITGNLTTDMKSKKSPTNTYNVTYNMQIEELPVIDNSSVSDNDDDIHSQKRNFNKTFVPYLIEKGKLKVGSAKNARIDKAESNSFFTTTGTEFEDDGNTTVRSKKTITSESNKTSSNFSTECEVDKTKNAITEQSGVTAYSPKEISENKNMFTNEKIIKNITDKNGILREEFNGKTSEARKIFEGDSFNFNKSQQHPNAIENFKGIDIWKNRADGGKIHEKDENINSVKMKIFTYDNSVNTQPENKLKINHQGENNDHNSVTKSPKLGSVKNKKEIFDNKCEAKQSQNTPNKESKKEYVTNQDSQKLNTQDVALINVNSLRNRFDSSIYNQKSNEHPGNRGNMGLPLEKHVSGENIANNFLGSSETSTQHSENHLGDNGSVLTKNENLGKKAERKTEPKKEESTLTPTTDELTKESTHNVIGESSKKLSDNGDNENGSTIIAEMNQKAVPGYINYELNRNESIPNSVNEIQLRDKPINSPNNNLDFLLDRVNSLIGDEEQQKKYENDTTALLLHETSAKSNPEKLDKNLDHLLNKVDNLIDNIEQEERSTRKQKSYEMNNYKKTMKLDLNTDLDFLMSKINKLIEVTEEKRDGGQITITEDTQNVDFIVKEPEESSAILKPKTTKKDLQENTTVINENPVAEKRVIATNSLNDETNNKLGNSEKHPRHPSSVLTMIQRFESPITTSIEKDELVRGNTDGKSTLKCISYLEKRDRFIAMENMSGKGQNRQLVSPQVSVQGTISQRQELNEDDDLNLPIATKSTKAAMRTVKSEPSTPSPRTLINRKVFYSTKSQSYPSYSELLPDEPVCEFLHLTQKENQILPENRNNSKTSTMYIVTERRETNIKRNVYTHSFPSPTTEKIREIIEPPVKEHCEKENGIAIANKQSETVHRPASFSSIIKKGHSIDEEMFPDVSGFLKENNRQHPHVDYPKDFSVSRRVSRIESLQSLLAQNNVYVTSQIHRSHPNIYFGESPKRTRTHKPRRKLKSFDANLLTVSSGTQNDTNASRYSVDYDNCTKFQNSDIIEEKIPIAAYNGGAVEGTHTSRIIKSSRTEQAERKSEKAVSNCQINQEDLHDGTPSTRQLSLNHPDGFPSVKDLRSKFEKTPEPTVTENSIKYSKIKEKPRSLDSEKYSCLDSSEESSTSLKYFIPLINSTHPNNDNDRKNNTIKPLKHTKNIFSSIEVNANKNQSELALTQREDGVKEDPQPLVLKSTSEHHSDGGCKQGTTSPPHHSCIKAPEATNSIRSVKKTRQVVEHDKGKTPERGNNGDATFCEKLNVTSEEFETVDVKNIMKNQFTKARNFFKELEKSRHNYSQKRTLGSRGIKKRRKNSIGSGSFPKVSEKFPIRNIYKDVIGDRRGSFKGAPNRVGVANSMASVPVRHKYFNPDSAEILPSLDIFHRSRRPKSRKSLKSIFLVDY